MVGFRSGSRKEKTNIRDVLEVQDIVMDEVRGDSEGEQRDKINLGFYVG